MTHVTRSAALGALSFALIAAAGCMVQPATLHQSTAPTGSLQLFNRQAGLTVTIIDKRPRSVQNLNDAKTDNAFNAVYFRLTNPRLKAGSITKTVAKNPDGSGAYTAAFTGLPVDNAYSLTVGLYRNIATASIGSPSDPGYSVLDNRVGEGSAPVALAPGNSNNVLITINAVGDFRFDSLTYNPEAGNPIFISGDQDAVVDTHLNAIKSPQADLLRVTFLDATGSVVAGPFDLPKINNNWPTDGRTATVSVHVPYLPAPYDPTIYKVRVEALNASDSNHVLSTRTREVTVEPAASLNLNLDGASGSASPPPSPPPVSFTSAGNYYAGFDLYWNDLPALFWGHDNAWHAPTYIALETTDNQGLGLITFTPGGTAHTSVAASGTYEVQLILQDASDSVVVATQSITVY